MKRFFILFSAAVLGNMMSTSLSYGSDDEYTGDISATPKAVAINFSASSPNKSSVILKDVCVKFSGTEVPLGDIKTSTHKKISECEKYIVQEQYFFGNQTHLGPFEVTFKLDAPSTLNSSDKLPMLYKLTPTLKNGDTSMPIEFYDKCNKKIHVESMRIFIEEMEQTSPIIKSPPQYTLQGRNTGFSINLPEEPRTIFLVKNFKASLVTRANT